MHKLAMLLSVDETPEECKLPEKELPDKALMKQGFMAGEYVVTSSQRE